MNNWSEQIIYGTILGGSSLVLPKGGKNYYLLMRNKNLNWLEWKTNQIELFENKNYHKDNNTYRVYSKCDDFLTDVHYKFYDKNKRIIDLTILDTLQDIGLAVWFLEDGGKTGRDKKNAYLNAKKYKEDSQKIVEFFESLGLKCSINKNLRIIFSVDSTMRFLKIIAHRFPEFMHHRLL